jgi:hypothetical protein
VQGIYGQCSQVLALFSHPCAALTEVISTPGLDTVASRMQRIPRIAGLSALRLPTQLPKDLFPKLLHGANMAWRSSFGENQRLRFALTRKDD